MLSRSEVKYIQSLSQKKFRETEKCFVIEGPKIINEALTVPNINIKKIFGLQEWVSEHQNMLAGKDYSVIDEIDLARISELKTPNQVVAIVEMPWSEGFYIKPNNITLALDGIQDPGNMGTIIRIADWFGIAQIVCSMDCADMYNSKVIQASMGSLFRVELYKTDLEKWLQANSNLPIMGAVLEGVPLHQMPTSYAGVLVIGNESKGIRENILPYITQKITIPRYGQAESLNAAVATGIIVSYLK